MGSTIDLHCMSGFGCTGITADKVSAKVKLREEDGPGRPYGLLMFDFGGAHRVNVFVDIAQAQAIAAQLASGLLACLPVIGDPEAA